MKKNLVLFFLSIFGATLVSNAQDPITQVSHAVVYDEATAIVDGLAGYPAGHQTYRIYAELENATTVMQSALAIPGVTDLSIGTDNGVVWNQGSGFNAATLGEHVNAAFFPLVDPVTLHDSYVTIGSHSNVDPAGQTAVTAFAGTTGVDHNIDPAVFWGGAAYSDAANPMWIANNDGWLLIDVSGANAYGVGPNFQVTLAQITTTGDVAYNLNLTALTDTPANGGDTYAYYWDAAAVGNGAFANEAAGTNFEYPAAVLVDGCTDMSACNYDPAANNDDGSCCNDNCITLDMTDSYGDGWNGNTYSIVDLGTATVVATGDLDNAGTGDGLSVGQDFLCLPDGCYTISVDGGTFQYEIDWTLTGVDAGPISGGSPGTVNFSINTVCVPGCTDMGACNYDPAANVDDGSCESLSCAGCMNDMTACNYDPTATIDDGSCCSDNCITLDMTDSYGDGWNGNTYEIFDVDNSVVVATGDLNNAASGDGSSVGQDILCLPMGCYTITVDGGAFQYEVGWTLTGVDGGPISGGAPEIGTAFGVGGAVCGTPGCDDPTACNYDPAATVNDGSCVGIAANDVCGDATDLGSGDVVGAAVDNTESCIQEITTFPAGTDGGSSCQSNDGVCSFELDVDNDVWFAWTAGADESSIVITTSADGSGTFSDDTQLAVYSDCSGAGSLLAANDDNPAGGTFFSQVTLDCGVVAPGSTIYIQVDGYNGSAGTCLLDIDETAFPGGCPIPGCTDPGACNFDATAGIDDGSCEYTSCEGCFDMLACNYDPTATIDNPALCSFDNDAQDCATPLVMGSNGVCNSIPGDFTGATDQIGSNNGGVDRWYSFVATNSNASVQVTNPVGLSSDLYLELWDDGFTTLVDVEDETFLGPNFDEIMNVNGLVVGNTYRVGVTDWGEAASTGTYDICVTSYDDSGCDLPPSLAAGPFSIQSMLKADWRASATGYSLVLDDGAGGVYDSGLQASTWIAIATTGCPNADGSYEATLNAHYTVVDGDGVEEEIVAGQSCPISVNYFDTYLLAAHNCTNYGAIPMYGRPIAAPAQGYVTNYTWEFTQTSPVAGAAWEYTTATGNYRINASGGLEVVVGDDGVSMIEEGATYDVRIRANYAFGNASDFGTVDCMQTQGPAGAEAQGGPNADATANAERTIANSLLSEVAIYPNPSNGDYINLNVAEVNSGIVLVDVADMFGKLVQSIQLSAEAGAPFNTRLELNGLASGLYTVNITVDGVVNTEKLVIQK